MPSHHLLQEQQQQPQPQLPAGKSKKSFKSENKLKEKENKERKKKEKKAAKKEKERSASSSASTAVGSEKGRKESKKGGKPPAPIPPPQQVPQKRLIEHHEYQNISEETKIDSKSPVMRMFGDTNFLLNHRRKVSGQGQSQAQQQQQKESGLSCGQGVCELLNGVYRFSPHVTSFAELESNKSNVSTPTLIVGKGSSAASTNRSHPSTLDPKEYQNFNVSKYLNIDVKTPNLRKNHHHGHHGHHISSNASSLSSGSSGSNSLNSFDSVEQAIIFQKNKNADSYLGPFNFRQLLRPTQGPTESLRKRKGINPPSPPPLQRGKS